MQESIRFIHSGDLHLGSPLKTVGKIASVLQKSLRDSSYKAIENVIDAALNYDVDFVLICGDIYDNESRSVKGNLFLHAQMERLADKDIPVFIIYGNHDSLGRSADFFKLPGNVRVLGAEAVEMCQVSDRSGRIRARILGQSYGDPAENKKIHLNYQPPQDDLINIAMLHTGLDPGSNTYVPCSPQELKNLSTVHYWALGHIHAPTIINDENPVIAYPGIPQGRNVGESGLKGCLLVEAAAPDRIKVRFVPTSPIVWLTYKFSLDLYPSLSDIADLADVLVEEGQKIIAAGADVLPACSTVASDFKPEGYVVRWEISGRCPIHDALIVGNEPEVTETLEGLLNQRLSSQKPYLWTEGIKLHTASPIPDLGLLLEKDETLKTLHQIRQKVQKDENYREKAISAMGEIWYKPRRPEDLRDDTFPITAERFDSLLEDAFNLALERIVKEREEQ